MEFIHFLAYIDLYSDVGLFEQIAVDVLHRLKYFKEFPDTFGKL